MSVEKKVTPIESWLDNPLRNALRQGVSDVPAPLFREWKDEEPRRETLDIHMSEEHLAFTLRALRTDLHIATGLAVTVGGAKTSRDVIEYLAAHDLTDTPPFIRDSINPVLTELVKGGIIERERRGKIVVYSRPWNNDLPVAQLGYLYDLAKKYDTPITSWLGDAVTQRYPQNREMYEGEDISYTRDRIRILRMIQRARVYQHSPVELQITQSAVAEELGKSLGVAKDHLTELQKKGILRYDSINTENSNVALYERNADRELSPVIRNGHEFTIKEQIINLLARTDWPISPQDVVRYIADNDPTRNNMNDHQRKMLEIYAGEILRSMAHDESVMRLGWFSRDVKSHVSLRFSAQEDELSVSQDEDQVALMRDIVIALFNIQREDALGEKEGLKLAARFVGDKEGITKLLTKHRNQAAPYVGRRTKSADSKSLWNVDQVTDN